MPPKAPVADRGPAKLLLIHSHYGAPPELFAMAEAQGHGLILRERALTEAHFRQCSGVITTTHLDQIGFLRFRPALEALLDRGGRWFFNGHMLRELVAGAKIYQPIPTAKRRDLALTRLQDHPIFAGIDAASFEEIRGVAGFYGRGANPLPQGAVAITGLGPELLPLDWQWHRPQGGMIFSHAGNDLGGGAITHPSHAPLAGRIVQWTLGGLNA